MLPRGQRIKDASWFSSSGTPTSNSPLKPSTVEIKRDIIQNEKGFVFPKKNTMEESRGIRKIGKGKSKVGIVFQRRVSSEMVRTANEWSIIDQMIIGLKKEVNGLHVVSFNFLKEVNERIEEKFSEITENQ